MGIGKDYHVQDELEYENIPFLIEVYDTDMYINAKSGEVRGINMYGAPRGMKKGSWSWVVCNCLVASIRPDYPYSKNEEYSEVDKHVRVVEPYEKPSKGIVFYGKEEQRVDVEPVEIAEKAAEKLKKRFEDHETPDGVPSDII